uniref:Uncharacterized protein n=1 Tax=Trichogramma kaykai TaxID=54128 RepID=A0ABD2XF16_9HYME
MLCLSANRDIFTRPVLFCLLLPGRCPTVNIQRVSFDVNYYPALQEAMRYSRSELGNRALGLALDQLECLNYSSFSEQNSPRKQSVRDEPRISNRQDTRKRLFSFGRSLC